MQVVKKTDDPLYNALADEDTVKVVLDTAEEGKKVYITKRGPNSFRVSASDKERGGDVVGSIEAAISSARGHYFGAVE